MRAMGEGITSAGKGIATSMVEVLSLDGRSRQLAWGTAAVGLVLGVHQLGSSALTAPIVGNCTHTSEGLLAHRPGLLGCYQTFKVEISPLLLKLFQNIEEKETLSNPFYNASITLISKADENTTKKANDRPVFFINVDAKILNKCYQSEFNNENERSYTMIKGYILGMQRWFNIHNSITVTHHSNKIKDKNRMIISIDAKKKKGI